MGEARKDALQVGFDRAINWSSTERGSVRTPVFSPIVILMMRRG